MAKENIQEKRFPFLHAHIAREPHVYEVLNEIMTYQAAALKTGLGRLATMDDLKTSRNIKIPFTIARNKMIATLMDTLTKTYPAEIRSIITLSFAVEPETRRLSTAEHHEYAILLNNEEFNRIQAERNRESAENFLSLVGQFRLFNLTKLLKKVSARAILSQAVKSELGRNIFTYKNYTLDKQNNEIAEDYCFHRINYDAVRKTINLDRIRKIVANHSAQIARRLKNFGILNTEFGEYNDTKLDYLLNILLQDIYLSLSNAELTEVKNFNSLRSCLMKVETLIDPIIASSDEIAAFVRESRLCPAQSITAVFPHITLDKLIAWSDENAARYRIIPFRDENGVTYFIDGSYFMPRIDELHETIVYHPDELAAMGHADKAKTLDEMSLLCNAGRKLLDSSGGAEALNDAEAAARLQRIIAEYDQYQNRLALASAMEEDSQSSRKRRSIFEAIADFFRSLFSGGEDEDDAVQGAGRDASSSPSALRPSSRGEAKNILMKVRNYQGKMVPLSAFIELLPANEKDIEMIINDLRKLNMRIVIPVYNARKVLYPVRSQQYLIPDIEYLLVDPEIAHSSDTIREFTDSLAGEKIKDEKITGAAIVTVEKYLMSLYTQKKAAALKKGKSRR